MKMLKNKTAAIAIALLLILSMTASMLIVPIANAHTPPFVYPTYAYISVQPNPVGIGQQVSVNFWIDKAVLTANGVYGDRWQNFKVEVTHPDGTTENLGPFTSDAAGGAHTYYTPTTLGNYTFVFSWPGQTLLGANPGPSGTSNPNNVGDYFEPSTSAPYVLTVQEEPSPLLSTNPLPTNYWTRPIFDNNLPWYTIAGNWLGGGAGGNSGCVYNSTSNYDPYSTVPTTAHIMWTKPYAPGGLIGGEFGGDQVRSNFYATSQYEQKFAGVIINGVLYRTLEPASTNNYMGWEACDLRTGKTIWYQNQSATTWLRMGQIFDYVSINQYGGLAYLWANLPTVAPNTGSTYGMFDAMTGGWILNIVNATAPTWAQGPNGEVLGYYINRTSTTYTLNMWNSTQAILKGPTGRGDINSQTWRPSAGASIPWSYGVQWTVPIVTTIALANGTTVDIDTQYAQDAGDPDFPLAISKVADVILVDNSAAGGRFDEPGYFIQEAYSPIDGHLLWGPLTQTLTPFVRTSIAAIGGGVYALFIYATQEFYGYSTATGKKIWGPVSIAVKDNPWGYYITHGVIGANNRMYVDDFGGNVWCLDTTNGAIIWHNSTNTVSSRGVAGANTPYGVWTIANAPVLTNGAFVTMGGHLYSPPLYNGGSMFVWNTTNGNLLWQILEFATSNGGEAAVADGYMVVTNGYDNQLYCYGMGPSKLTVTAPTVGVTTSTPITISGTVTDISAGSQQDAVTGNFPNGLPCVSDASMTDWMEYVYQQQQCPATVTGVPVSIDVLDSNGNYRNIGTATSDGSGTFGLTWTPDIPGDFTVIATFAGSGSYYPSNAEAHFTAAVPAPTASPYPTVNLPPTEMYIVAGVIAIIIAIAIVGALILMAVKKRP
jgi:hypothetical protein